MALVDQVGVLDMFTVERPGERGAEVSKSSSERS